MRCACEYSLGLEAFPCPEGYHRRRKRGIELKRQVGFLSGAMPDQKNLYPAFFFTDAIKDAVFLHHDDTVRSWRASRVISAHLRNCSKQFDPFQDCAANSVCCCRVELSQERMCFLKGS